MSNTLQIMNTMKILSCFVLFCFCAQASVIVSSIQIVATGNPNTAENLKSNIESTLLAYMSQKMEIVLEESLFFGIVPALSAMASISYSQQYKHLVDALFKYINNVSLSVIMKSKKNELEASGSEAAVNMMLLAANETRFFKQYKISDSIPDKTVTLILRAITELKPDPSLTRDILLILPQFCESDSCQDFLYPLILDHFTNCNDNTPATFNISPNLQNTDKYDKFVRNCFDLHRNESTKDRIPRKILISNIIFGPGSRVAADILLILMSEKYIRMISKNELLMKEVTRFLLKSGRFDQFVELLTPELCNKDSDINNMNNDLIKWKEMYDRITRIVSFVGDLSDVNILKQLLAVIQVNESIFSDYYKIDPNFVTECVVILNKEIFSLIEQYSEYENSTIKASIVSTSFVLINLIPRVVFHPLLGCDYEPLLDQHMDPAIAHLNPPARLQMLIRTIQLPFAKITSSTIVKLYRVMSVYESVVVDDFIIFSVSVILLRDYDNLIFMDAIKSFHQAFEDLQFNFSELVSVIACKVITNEDQFLFKEFLTYCQQHRLLPKSLILVTKKYDKIFHADFNGLAIK